MDSRIAVLGPLLKLSTRRIFRTFRAMGKMKKFILPALALLLTTGCATWSDLDQGLRSLHGQPLSVAISKIGYPTDERQIAGMRLVSWSSSKSGIRYVQQSSTTYGTAYSKSEGKTKYSTTTNYMVPQAYRKSCEITLQVSERNIIQASQYQGDIGGCWNYITALKQPSPYYIPTADGATDSSNQHTTTSLEQGATAKKDIAASTRSDYLLCVKNAAASGTSATALKKCEPLAVKHREAAFSLSIATYGKDPFSDATAADTSARQEAAKIAAAGAGTVKKNK